jgi:lysophospholipase L1-like esterase
MWATSEEAMNQANGKSAPRRILAAVLSAQLATGVFAAPIKIATIGDSITQGNGSSNQFTESYPALLQDDLGGTYQVQNDGCSGTSAMRCPTCNSYWNSSQYATAKSFLPDVAIICLGTNDINVWNWQYKAQFPVDYGALVDTFINLPSHPQVFCCLPPTSYRRTATDPTLYTAARIDSILPPIIQVAQQRGVCIIDLNTLTTGHPEYFNSDSLHPNDSGAAVIARYVQSILLKRQACYGQITAAAHHWDCSTNGAQCRARRSLDVAAGNPGRARVSVGVGASARQYDLKGMMIKAGQH